jgi:hypothetical protein
MEEFMWAQIKAWWATANKTVLSMLLAVLGIGLLVWCMIWTAIVSMSVETEASCRKNLAPALTAAATPDDNAGKLRIAGVFPDKVSLGSQLCVAVAGVAAKPADAQAAASPPVDIGLLLNNQRTSLSTKADATPAPQLLVYPFGEHADATSDESKFWRGLLAGKTKNGTMALSVAVARAQGNEPSARAGSSIDFIVYKAGILAVGMASMVVLVLAFAVFAKNSDVLRDSNGKTYSLGRAQMALWLGLSVSGFIFLWLTLGFYLHVITSGILVLLGINSVTGLASVVMDSPGAASPPAGLTSRGFWIDLICDDTGKAQLHRIQMIAWTCILAIIFVWNVFWNFIFVDFDTNLLLLMGIASGTYLGFKTQEK